jgi:hypothetical protein
MRRGWMLGPGEEKTEVWSGGIRSRAATDAAEKELQNDGTGVARQQES